MFFLYNILYFSRFRSHKMFYSIFWCFC